MKYFAITPLAFVLAFSAIGVEVDQSQILVDFVNDEGQGSGQTFTAGKNGFLTGVRLCMRNHNYPRDFRITLNATSHGNPTTNVITSVDVSGSTISTGNVQWYEFHFDSVYAQTKGELLSFVYYSLPPSDPYGWNDLAFDTSQSYSNGFHFYIEGDGWWTSAVYPLRDYSFQTIIIPAPSMSSFSISNDTVYVATDTSETSLVYRLQYATNLTPGVWLDYSSHTGTASSIDWQLPCSTNKSMFFRIISEQR